MKIVTLYADTPHGWASFYPSPDCVEVVFELADGYRIDHDETCVRAIFGPAAGKFGMTVVEAIRAGLLQRKIDVPPRRHVPCTTDENGNPWIDPAILTHVVFRSRRSKLTLCGRPVCNFAQLCSVDQAEDWATCERCLLRARLMAKLLIITSHQPGPVK